MRVPWRLLVLGGVLAGSLALCVLAIVWGGARPETLQALVARAGPWGMAAYVAGVVVMEVLWMPRGWGLLVGGALFGPVAGGLLSVAGDMTGAYLCYALARGTGREWVAGLLSRRPRTARVVEMLARRRGTLTVAVLRVCPVAHYTLVSYAAGLGGVRPAPFLLGTGLGIVPAAIVYPLMGHAALTPGSPLFAASVGVVAVFLLVTVVAARRLLRS